jgi:hypothetical protein
MLAVGVGVIVLIALAGAFASYEHKLGLTLIVGGTGAVLWLACWMIKKAVEFVVDSVQSLWQSIVEALASLWETITDFLSELFELGVKILLVVLFWAVILGSVGGLGLWAYHALKPTPSVPHLTL